MRFRDRAEAGQLLADALSEYANRSDVMVLALPRGGVPVAAEVARRLNAPLDLWLVRKIGVPGHPEFAIGAIAEGGIEVLNDDLIRVLGLSLSAIEHVAKGERTELERQAALYRAGRQPPDVRGRTVVLVDDGLATGSTMHAAALALRHKEPERIVVAVPVGAEESCQRLQPIADEVVCASTPEPFEAVGLWYEDFAETTDTEVKRLLRSGASIAVPS